MLTVIVEGKKLRVPVKLVRGTTISFKEGLEKYLAGMLDFVPMPADFKEVQCVNGPLFKGATDKVMHRETFKSSDRIEVSAPDLSEEERLINELVRRANALAEILKEDEMANVSKLSKEEEQIARQLADLANKLVE